jgi:hypothetical protein
MKKDINTTVSISFPNEAAAKYFMGWFSESGEQQYWLWQDCVEERIKDKNITAVDFDFITDFKVKAVCGRLDGKNV